MPLNVLMIPDPMESPYLTLLCTNLLHIGIRVYFHKARSPILAIIKAIFNRNEVQVIHVHWLEYFIRSKNFLLSIFKACFFIILIMLLKYFFHTRIVVTLHNIIPHESIHPKLEYLGFLKVLKLCDAIIVHNTWSKDIAQHYFRIFSKKFFVVPHGNFIEYYKNTASCEKARKKLGIPSNKFVVSFFGAIRQYKGIEILLKAFEEIVSKYNEFYLLVAGRCGNYLLCKKLIELQRKYPRNFKVVLTYIPDDKVQYYINASNIGVIPYLEITTSGSLLLYMSFGKPVIVPRLKPLLEVASEKFAFFFNKGDYRSLKKTLLEAYLRRAELPQFGARALKQALLYDWRSISIDLYKIYKGIVYKEA